MHRLARPFRLALACGACALGGLASAGCGPEVPIREPLVVREWSPPPPGSGTAAVGSSERGLFDLPRGSRYNVLGYREERLRAEDRRGVVPLYQVGVGFPVRDWVSGYFLPNGEYIMGEEWTRYYETADE